MGRKKEEKGLDLPEILMRKFLIERHIPGASTLKMSDIRTVAKKSVSVLADLGVDIQWVESYISGDKIYCIYLATDEDLIREHSRLAGIPANSITEVVRVMDPTVAFEAV
jgi:methionine synthase I (cobalamin-dependent)